MSDKLHKRIFSLTYLEKNLPMFKTDEEHDEFMKALGRMVFYGLSREAPEDQIDLVTARLTQNPLEICAGYSAKMAALDADESGHRWYRGSTEKLCTEFQEEITNRAWDIHRPFVMAAVQHSDGKFGFHS